MVKPFLCPATTDSRNVVLHGVDVLQSFPSEGHGSRVRGKEGVAPVNASGCVTRNQFESQDMQVVSGIYFFMSLIFSPTRLRVEKHSPGKRVTGPGIRIRPPRSH